MGNIGLEIANFFYPLLIAVIGFFLLQFYLLVKNINQKTTEILIELGKKTVRIDNLEYRLEKLETWKEKIETELNEIKQQIHK